MTDNEFLLFDRIEKIKSVIGQYGEENFYISFSGGKDSTVLSALVDMALPGNRIPRVYADTGIELNMVRDFVYDMQKRDDRVHIVKPLVPIKEMLEREGYPFKSKEHSKFVERYLRLGLNSKSVRAYVELEPTLSGRPIFRPCPKVLRYQFEKDGLSFPISDKCCSRLKEEPIRKWQTENHMAYAIVGIMAAEGGRRTRAQCLAFEYEHLKRFQPLIPVTKEWEEWLIETKRIEICDIYKSPYNFERTGCKGCPFALYLQEELDILEKYFPAERKQCEIIWKPVYAEYRRIGYRLKKDDGQVEMTDLLYRRKKDD